MYKPHNTSYKIGEKKFYFLIKNELQKNNESFFSRLFFHLLFIIFFCIKIRFMSFNHF